MTKRVALGTKDHSKPGNGLDASDRDGALNIANWPLHGMFQPDAIAAFRARGDDDDGGAYGISANEGDARGTTACSATPMRKPKTKTPATSASSTLLAAASS